MRVRVCACTRARIEWDSTLQTRGIWSAWHGAVEWCIVSLQLMTSCTLWQYLMSRWNMVRVVRKVQTCQLALRFDSIIYCSRSYPAKRLSSPAAGLNPTNDLASWSTGKFLWSASLPWQVWGGCSWRRFLLRVTWLALRCVFKDSLLIWIYPQYFFEGQVMSLLTRSSI